MKIGRYILLFMISLTQVMGQVRFTEVDAGDLSWFPGGSTFGGGETLGGTWVDFDRDGDLDYLDGRLFYENISTGAFVADSLSHQGNPPVVVDLNNDGLLDLVIGGVNFFGSNQENDSVMTKVFINTGEGFKETILDNAYGYFSATGVDINGDDYVDIFLTDPKGNRLFINNQGDSFTENDELITGDGGWYYGTWADYDQDGDMDLLGDGLYQNLGEGVFEKVVETEGSCWGDVNNDGLEDFFGRQGNSMVIFINQGDGNFEAKTIDQLGIDLILGSTFFDIDNDGDLDFLASGLFGFPLYLNDKGDFIRSSFVTSAGRNPIITLGHSIGDFNQDGHLDVLIGTDGGSPNYVYQNDGNSNGWLSVQLEGVESNADGIGARVIVEAQINGELVKQYRTQRVRQGPHSGNLTMHFGLGNAALIEKLTIEWPSGKVTELSDLNVRQWVTISENMITAVPSKYISSSIVYPNPVVESFVFKCESTYLGQIFINIYSMKGEQVKSISIDKSSRSLTRMINALELSKGTYVLQIQMGDVTLTQKLVKE